MVIACYAGVGKSTFARKYTAETIDLYSMPFSWILPEKTDGEFEDVKAAPYLLRNPAFPDNYIAAILRAEQNYKYVLIPTICSVLEELYETHKLPYVICYPRIELKEEYSSRYMDRGNTADFTAIFIDQWEDRIQMLMNDRNGKHFRLESGMFLTDMKDEIDLAMESVHVDPKIMAVRSREIMELNEIAETKMRQGCISIMGPGLTHYYFPLDFRKPENRKWAYELGKICYENNIFIGTDDVQWLETFYDHEYGSDPNVIRKFHDKQEVMDYCRNRGDTEL